ncbi:imidazolonepropionase [Moraxella nasibovis]|uniref:imidazolonepropionase n=1 Tax=Moraxella nasibovis TaxID=2904120 RepID=UPI0024105B1A|nr:imidazolonepropionase [Moraxella nasibovis]WFF39014.1 imidazolonepropionase [Moraxella nasibovis]
MNFDTLIINANIATMNPEFGYGNNNPYGTIINSAVGIKDGKITFVGQIENLGECSANKVIELKNHWLTPALLDCHTHLVYGGNRSNEFEMRLNGVDYTEIAKNGGGILSTVRATRELSFDELYELSAIRLKDFINQGVGTIEIKSGYGLDLTTEKKMLMVAKKLGEEFNVNVQKTYLALHALPPEYKDKADDYVELACEWLRQLHAENLIDAVDAFCENIAFNREQVSKLFSVAKELNLPVKLHAEQLSDMNGAGLVAEFNGLSADHIEYLSEENIKKMSEKGVVGVLLPTAFYTLKETKVPPIDLMRKYKVKMAVSTDCNPGTSPSTSLLLAMNMACTLFKLTPEESLAGVTVNSAKALGLEHSKGQIKVGMDADLVLWDIDRPADLSYLIGQNRLSGLWLQGREMKIN